MHISKIYIQDNFIPNINRDQFRRKVFGMEITIKEGEDVGQAISEAETHIANYIKINTVPMDDECRGTKVVDIVEDAPIDRRIAGIIEDIDSLTVIDAKNGFGVQVGLLSYEELAETDPQIKEAYLKKYDELTNKTK